MNHRVEEPVARYLAALAPPLLRSFDLLAGAPKGVARLRELILTLAVRGKLVAQDPKDEPASVLLERIRAEKARLLAEGKVRREKPLAEISEEEKPFELPAGWEWVRLNQLLTKIGAGSTPLGGREVYVPQGIKFLRSQNVWNDGLRLADVAFIPSEVHQRMSGTLVQVGDLLFNITGASIGRCAVVPNDFDEANVSQHVTIIRPAVSGITAYLHKVLISNHVQQAVMDVQVGVSREGLSIAKLGFFLTPLPPLAEQSRIVARVDALMRLCDELEAKGRLEAEQHARLVGTLFEALAASESAHALAENWQRIAAHFDLLLDRPEAVDALEQTLLQLAVRGLLVPQDPADEPASTLLENIRAEKHRRIAAGKLKRDKPLPPVSEDEKPFELPEGWEWVRLQDIAQSRLGKMLDKAKNTGSAFPYLRNTNVQWGRFELDEIKEIYLEPHELNDLRLLPGDLLICEGGEPGRCSIWQDNKHVMYFQKALHRVRPYGAVLPEYMEICIRSDANSGALEKYFTGATIKHFSGQELNRYVLSLPPLHEQSRIVARVEQLRRLCADLRAHLGEARATQSRLAETLVEQTV